MTFLERKDADRGGVANAASARDTLSMLMGIFETARIVPRVAPSVMLPLTIISGFLGAGKTTLVNRLLTKPGGRRIAVLVNDFAAVNIDEELIRFQSDDTIALTNGCACCSINGDLVNAIQRLVERVEAPDAIVLEASGLADPRGIALTALANPAMRLDAVVTLVDAETFPERLRDERTQSTMLSQLSAADIVAVSKSDLIGERRSEILELIETSASGRTVVEMTHGNIPAEIVLGVTGRAPSTFMCSPADHAGGFASTARTWTHPVDKDLTVQALRNLPHHVIRAKGIFSFKGEDRPYIYQRVGRRESLEAAVGPLSLPSESRLVMIGFADLWKEAEISALIP